MLHFILCTPCRAMQGAVRRDSMGSLCWLLTCPLLSPTAPVLDQTQCVCSFSCSGIKQFWRVSVLHQWPCVHGLSSWHLHGLLSSGGWGSSQSEVHPLWYFPSQPRGIYHFWSSWIAWGNFNGGIKTIISCFLMCDVAGTDVVNQGCSMCFVVSSVLSHLLVFLFRILKILLYQ